MTDDNSSATKPKKKYNNKKRNNNRKNYKASGNKPNNNSEANSGNNKNSNANRNRRPKSLTPARILQKYDNLMDQYIVARRKFFDMFGRTAGKQLEKVKNNYSSSLNSLRDFEVKLEDWQKEVLDTKINGYKPDREYSKNHELKPEGDIVSFTGDFEDPHLLVTQKATEWALDTEESQGTIEDYKKYKDSY